MTRLQRGAFRLALLAALPFLTGCGYAAVLIGGYFTQSSQSKGGGGVVVVQTAEGVDLVVGRGPKDLGDTTEGRGEAVVAAQFRLGVTSAATLQTVRVTGQGSGDEGGVTSVKLFHDLDGDGALGNGEPQLGTTQTFSGDEGQATFGELAFSLESGVSVDLLVVSELPTDALDGDTFRIELSDDQALEATTQVNGESARIRVFGAPISGGVRTISSTGTLTLSLGAQTPSAGGVFPNAQDVEVLQLDLRASSVEDIRIDSLTLQAGGTLNDLSALGTIELFEDSDNDGLLNRVTDLPLASLAGAPSDNGALAFSGLGRTLPKSALRRWLLVYQLNGSALDGQTFRADLNSASDVVGLGLSSNQAPAVQGTPIQGGATLTVQRAGLNLSVGPFNPARDATPAQSGVGVLQLRVAASGAEPVVVSSLGVRGAGSGDEQSDLAGVRLYVDQDGDGEFDAGEVLLAGPASYPSDDGTLTLGGFSRELQPGAVELWLVVYDLGASATGGDQFTATLAGPSTVAVSGRTSGLVLTPIVPAVSGGVLTVRGSLALAAGATQPASPNRVLANSNDAPTLQVVVGAGAGESVRLTGVTLTPSGTGNDQLALSGVDLYEDVDLSGTVNGGDALIQTQNYPGDDQALTFSAAGGLLAGDIAPLTSRTLLVRYRFSGQALEGQTFAFNLPTTALTATGVSSARPIPVSGPLLTTSGNPLQTQRARITFAFGPENPNASDVLNGTTVPVLQLLAATGPGEALNLSTLTFRSSGTANETAVVQQARLYLEGSGPRGTVDGTDTQLGAGQTFSADDGFVTFSGAPLASVAISSSASLLLAYDILPGAPAGGTFTARLSAAGDVSGAGGASGLSPEVLGAPLTGQPKAISRGTLAAALGTQTPPAANTFPNRSGVRVLQATLSAGSAETVRVSSLRLTAAGSADESIAVGGISLYLDLNQDGIVSGGDTLLASAASITNDGSVVLTGFNLDIPPAQARSLLVTCDVTAAASPGTTLRFRVGAPAADLVALGLTSAQPITPSGAALEGNVLSLVLGALALSQPASSPGATTELNSGQGVPMLQLRCAANATESARLSTFVVTHVGTGVPAAHVSSASLYHDVNGNGVLDGDTLLTTATFAGTTATFTIPSASFDVAQSSTRDLLVTYDFNGAAPVGATFRAQLASNANISALGISSNLALPVTGAPLTGGLKTLEAASLIVAAGANNPGAGNTLRNQASLVSFQGTLSAGSAEPVRLTSLRVSASGTLDLAAEVSRIRLYRENDPPNGVLDGDVLIGDQAGGFTGGAHTFALGASALQIPAGGSKAVLVVLDLGATAGSAGETLTISLAANADLSATGVVSGQPVGATGAPVSGNPQSVVEASLGLALGPNTPSASDVAVVSSGVAVLQARLGAGGAEPVRVTSLRFQINGSPTSGVTLARLYRDDNNNGALDGDALLGSGTLSGGGDITFTPSAGSLDVAPVGSRDVLLVLDFGNTASEGQTFSASLPTNGDVLAQGLTSALAITASGAPLTGNPITTREGSLTVAAGTPPPAQNVFNNASGVSALHLSLQAGANDGVRVTALTLRASGSADDTGLQVDLYRDTNGNGTLEGGEPLLQSQTLAADEGAATFGFGAGVLEVAAGQTGFVLARVTLPGTASVGQTHSIRLQAVGDVSAQGLSTAAPASVLGAPPIQGPIFTAQATSLTLSGPTPQSPAENVFPNASEVRMLRVQLDAGSLEAVRVTQLVLRPTGASTGDDTAATVSLYLDTNTNGSVEVGTDTLIQTQAGANASVTFAAGVGLVDVPASGSRQLLLVYALGAPAPSAGEGFQLALATADVTAQGLGSAAPVTAGGATQTGGLKTVAVGTLSLAAGANNPTAGGAFSGQTRVMQQLRLSAGVEAVRLDSLQIRHSGTGDPATDLAQVLLYQDLNGNGQVDGDPLLDTATFSGANATFSQGGGLLSVSPGSPVDLLVVYTFGAAASEGETFSLLAGAPADIGAVGVSSNAALTPSGAGAAGGVQTFRVGALTLATGPAPPAAGSVAVPTSRVAIQQLSLSATGEGARLQTLTIGFSGSGSVAHVQTASLYLDSDGDGALGALDTLVQALPMSAATLMFSQGGGLATVSTSSVLRLLVTYDLNSSASPGETYGADLLTAGEVVATGEIGGAAITVSGSAAASNLQTVLASGTLALSAGSNPPGAASVFPNQSQAPIQQLRLSASGENARVTNLTINLAGTGASSALTQARLYADQNADGAVDAGDVLLGVSNFTGAQVSFVAPGGLIEVPAGTPRELLIAYDFNGSGGIGDTFGAATIANTDLVALGVSSGATLAPSGSVAASNLQTLVASGTLVVANGPANPGPQNAGTSAVGVVAQQFSLSASGEGVTLNSVALTRAGTGSDGGVAQVRLFLDLNSNGLLDGDTQLAAGTFSGGSVTLGAGGLTTIGVGTTARFLVVFDFAATGGETYQADAVAAVDIVSQGQSSGAAITASGSAALGGLVTITLQPVLNVTQTLLGDSSIYPTQSRSVALRLQINETASQPARLKQLGVAATGSADESSAVSLIRLYRNVAPLGNEVGGEDVLIGLTAYFANDGTAVFGGLNELVPPGGTLELLVAYEVAGASGSSVGESLVATLLAGAVSLEPDGGGAGLTPTGLPLTGRTLTIGAQLELSVGPNNPSGTIGVALNETQAEILQLDLSATHFDASVTRLTIDASGSGDDSASIAKAELYRDTNQDGVLDGGDTLIQSLSSPYLSDNGTFLFAGLSEVVVAGTSTRWLVSYDIGGTGAGGETFSLAVDSTSDLASDAAVTTGTLPAQAATLELRGGVSASLGAGELVGALHAGVGDQQVFHVALSVDSLENMNLASLSFVASGSVPDDTWISAAQLWLDDGDDVFEPGVQDTELGSAQTFPGDDGTITFAGLGQTLTLSTTAKLWVSLDLAGSPPVAGGSGFKLTLQSGGATLSGATTGGAVTPTGLPVLGPLRLTSTFAPVQTQATAFTSAVRRSDVQTADMDLDGSPDLVALGSNYGIEVLLGDGGGSFVSKVERTFAGSGLLRSLALADFNRDGYPDVVVTTQNEVFVALNQGAVDPGNLSGTVTLISGAVNELSGVEFGDVDRDGDLDIVAADVGSEDLRHHLNNGSGGFSLGTVLGFTGGVKLSGRFQLVDLNNDGLLDYLLTARAGSTHFTIAYPGNGAGGANTGTAVAAGTDSQDVVAGHVAASGSPDVVALDQAGSAYFSYPSGTPILSSASTAGTAGVSSFTQPRRIALLDLDQDGSDDLVILHRGVDGVVAHIGSGSLSFPSSLALDLPSGSDADRLAAADFDNDGDLDLVVVSSTVIGQELYYLEGQQVPILDPFSATESVRETWNQEPERIATGDFNRDGLLDYVLVSDGGSRVAVFLQDSGGGFTKGLDADLGQNGKDIATADVDRDGALDLVASRSGLGLRIYKGDGTGGFGSAIDRATSALDQSRITLGDTNRDGSIDALGASPSSLSVQTFRGDGTDFGAGLLGDQTAIGSNPLALVLADFDKDGVLDLATIRNDSVVSVYPGLGNYGYGLPVSASLNGSMGTPRGIMAGDLDDDGAQDLVVIGDNNTMEIFKGNGSGGITSQGTRTGRPASEGALVDLDRDGDLDIVLAQDSGALVRIELTNRTTLSFGAPVTLTLSSGENASGLAVADFNGNGKADVIVAGQSEVQVFLR